MQGLSVSDGSAQGFLSQFCVRPALSDHSFSTRLPEGAQFQLLLLPPQFLQPEPSATYRLSTVPPLLSVSGATHGSQLQALTYGHMRRGLHTFGDLLVPRDTEHGILASRAIVEIRTGLSIPRSPGFSRKRSGGFRYFVFRAHNLRLMNAWHVWAA